MIRVGLTGNVAAGKSTVARAWAAAGIPIVSADELARQAVAPGAPAEARIREMFGDEVFADDGSLDRARLRSLVFRDPKARSALEELLHPQIRALRERWLEDRLRDGEPLVVSEVPLLFEAGLEDEFDVIVFVDAPAMARENRLVVDRGLAREEARRILAAQGDPSLKLERADYVIQNAGTVEELKASSMEVLARIESAWRESDP